MLASHLRQAVRAHPRMNVGPCASSGWQSNRKNSCRIDALISSLLYPEMTPFLISISIMIQMIHPLWQAPECNSPLTR
jgi:hypothetical protein